MFVAMNDRVVDGTPVETQSPDVPLRHLADSVGDSLGVLTDRWSFLIVREMFLGASRFTELEQNLGLARNMLSQRLKRLLAQGVIQRQQYCEFPPRFSYHFTEKGEDLYGVSIALLQWGQRWLDDKPALALHHATDQGPIEQIIRCRDCGEELTIEDLDYTVAGEAGRNGHEHSPA